MGLFKKESKVVSSVPRIAKMNDHELYSWGGILIMELGKTFDNHHYKDGPVEEVTAVLDTFTQIWQELQLRKS
jgi:hypothetical protein